MVDASLKDRFVEALEAAGAVVPTREETAQVVERAFDDHWHLLLQYVGRAAPLFAEMAGLESKEGASILVFPVTDDVPEEALGKERLAPVCSLFTVDGDDEAIALCKRLLSYEGAGHTAVIHTSDPDREARFATAIPAGRILVNVPATLGFCGVVNGPAAVVHARLRDVRRQLDHGQRGVQEPAERQAGGAPHDLSRRMPDTSRTSPLAAVPLLAGLEGNLLDRLAAQTRSLGVKAGEWLFREGDPADSAYVIAMGRLEVVAEGPPETVLRTLKRGDVLGELALLREGRRSASVRAVRDTWLVTLGRGDFEALMRTSPDFALALTRNLGSQLAAEAVRRRRTRSRPT